MQPGLFLAHALSGLPDRSCLVCARSLGARAQRSAAASARIRAGLTTHDDRMGDTMAHIQGYTETYPLLLQAKDFLVEARRLKPGPARNELREVAKVLREIAEDEARSVA